jgi:hypothetical protein
VGWAAFFNFIAFMFFGLHVAKTVGKGIISPRHRGRDQVIFGALMGAIIWNIVTWLAGIPSSSSHALIGGLVGAGICQSRFRRRRRGGPGQDRRRHRAVARHRLRPGAAAGADRVLGLRQMVALRDRQAFRYGQFISASPIRSAMAATMRRRPWASSRCCCSPMA